jgi:hypothetical protein
MLKDMEWFRRNKRKRGQLTGGSQYVDEIEKKDGWNFGAMKTEKIRKINLSPFSLRKSGK